MRTGASPATASFLSAACDELEAGLRKIKHAVGQLTDAQIWWRPADDMNSIANLLLHLDGNLRQWLIAGLSDQPDTRQRQAEFDDSSSRPSAELVAALERTIMQGKACICSLSDEAITRVRRVQEFDVNAAQAMWDSISHFKGHVQEIVHLTRMQLGTNYEFEFVPADQGQA